MWRRLWWFPCHAMPPGIRRRAGEQPLPGPRSAAPNSTGVEQCRSELFSRTTVVGTRSTASACACARAPAGRSSRPAAARVGHPSRSDQLLPGDRRLRRSADISTTARGTRVGGRLVVLHAAPAAAGKPRFGFAVGRKVGNSVTRHRVARRLRHVLAGDVRAWDELGCDVLVRALPSAAAASSAELAADLGGGRRRLAARLARPEAGAASSSMAGGAA